MVSEHQRSISAVAAEKQSLIRWLVCHSLTELHEALLFPGLLSLTLTASLVVVVVVVVGRWGGLPESYSCVHLPFGLLWVKQYSQSREVVELVKPRFCQSSFAFWSLKLPEAGHQIRKSSSNSFLSDTSKDFPYTQPAALSPRILSA